MNRKNEESSLLAMSFGALGIVFGDIGTSPLYAIKESFNHHNLEPTLINVLGVLSLIFWSLFLVVFAKYILYVMRAENHGEGGVLALLALANQKDSGQLLRTASEKFNVPLLVLLGLSGAALLAADGAITPAISVLSAVEGLSVATSIFDPYIVPITILIIISLFVYQRHGTDQIAKIFSPMMMIWFLTIALIGLPKIIENPVVFKAINPLYACELLMHHGSEGFLILGSVVLCITGAEALYADMGHFNRRSIANAWYYLVCPCLLLNYFGQGANIVATNGQAIANPFFNLVSGWQVYPLVILSAFATIIASQALISGAFSLAQQAIQLGYCPRLTIVHTSDKSMGQIYIPEINWALLAACLFLILEFQESSALAAAYGIAVVGTMTITSIMMFYVTRRVWKWNIILSIVVTTLILTVDLIYLTANLPKVLQNGWFPLVLAAAVFVMMIIWKKGRFFLRQKILEKLISTDEFVERIQKVHPTRISGTAVFLTSNMHYIPLSLFQHFSHHKTLHERVFLLTITTKVEPYVQRNKGLRVVFMGENIYEIICEVGFMEKPDVYQIFEQISLLLDQTIDIKTCSFYLGRESIVTTGRSEMLHISKSIFNIMMKNSLSATSYFNLPRDRVIEIGSQIEI